MKPPGARPTWAYVRLNASADGQQLLPVLQRFSPRVAVVPGHHNMFRADVSGMVSLYPSHSAWGQKLVEALHEHQVTARLAIGFIPFNLLMVVYALPQAHPQTGQGMAVFASVGQERGVVDALPLHHAPLSENSAHLAQELGLRTVGCLLRLSAGQVAQALGQEALALHSLAHHRATEPLKLAPQPDPCVVEAVQDPPDSDSTRLLFVCKALLPALIAKAQERQAVLAAIDVTLVLEAPNTLLRRPPQELTQRIEAGRPGRQEAPWLALVRLALEAWPLQRAVQMVRLTGHLQAPAKQQLQLWPQAGAARDEAHTTAAISQLRARFGDDAITCAQLRPSHRPEQQFAYVPSAKLALAPRAQAVDASARPAADLPRVQPLMRRVLAEPAPLTAAQMQALRRHRAAKLGMAPARAVGPPAHLRAVPPRQEVPCGPFKLSHGWWQEPCDRDYYYLPQPQGPWLWIFFDRHTRQWRLHGHVD